MKQQKPNNVLSRLLGLTLCFLMSAFVLSVGTAYARYQFEIKEEAVFHVREPEKVMIGTMDDGVFSKADNLEWKVEKDIASLQLTVANGSSETDFCTRDQIVRFWMVGSLGVMENGAPSKVSVTFLDENKNWETKTVQAYVRPIEEGTALYHSYGDGWLYRFFEFTVDGEKELTWELPGGEFNYITLTAKIEGEIPDGVTFLQPFITAETKID